MVKRRVPELAEMTLSKLSGVTTEQPVAMAVAKLIQTRCEQTMKKFRD
jgi:hypothetical protein